MPAPLILFVSKLGKTDVIHLVLSGAPITPTELRLAGLFAFGWFLMDVVWFVSTLNHWFGL